MATLLILLGVFVALGALFLLAVVCRTPEGYEDEKGFHLGNRPIPNAHEDFVTDEDIAKAREDFEKFQGQSQTRY